MRRKNDVCLAHDDMCYIITTQYPPFCVFWMHSCCRVWLDYHLSLVTAGGLGAWGPCTRQLKPLPSVSLCTPSGRVQRTQ